MPLALRPLRVPSSALAILAVLAIAIAVLVASKVWSAIPFALLGGIALIGVIFTSKMLQSLMIVVTTAAFALCSLECVAIFIEPVFIGDGGLGPQPTIGWGAKHPGRFHVARVVARSVQYEATYTIDDRLLRRVDAGTSGKGVAFLGDSFVFGTGLDDKDTLPQLFADDTARAFPVFNLGSPGFSSANVLAEFQSGWADDVMARTRLNVEFVAPWHAERLVCGSALSSFGPRYVLQDGKIQPADRCRPSTSILSVFAVYRVFIAPHLRRISDDDMALLVAVTDETIRASIEKHQIPIIVYYLRDPLYLRKLSWTDARIIASFKAAGAQVLDYTIEDGDPSRYKIRGDGHPTALANRVRAARLAAFVQSIDPALMEARAIDTKPSR